MDLKKEKEHFYFVQDSDITYITDINFEELLSRFSLFSDEQKDMIRNIYLKDTSNTIELQKALSELYGKYSNIYYTKPNDPRLKNLSSSLTSIESIKKDQKLNYLTIHYRENDGLNRNAFITINGVTNEHGFNSVLMILEELLK